MAGVEVWRVIPNSPNYSISDLGRLVNNRNGYILNPGDNGRGYLATRIKFDGRHKTVKIHKLVFSAFHGELSEGYEVNHRDGNKYNNRASNLEETTHQDNITHAYDNDLKPTRAVRIVETGETFKNATECAEFINGHISAVWACLNGHGRAKRHRGWTFEYV